LMDETHQLRGLAGNKDCLANISFWNFFWMGVVFNSFGSNAMTAI